MALYTLQVPDPPPGQDWFTVVPGQYLYNVTGITALLTTLDAAHAADASGHGNTLQYLFVIPADQALQQGWPGVLIGDTAQRFRTLDGATKYGDAALLTPSTMDWSEAFTIEWWMQNTAPGYDGNVFTWITSGAGFNQVAVSAAGQLSLAFDNGAGIVSGAGICPFDGGYHHYAVSVTASPRVGSVWYFDGDPVATGLVGPAPVPLPATDQGYSIGSGAPAFPGAADELAVYPSPLTHAQINAHFTAAPIFADYTAAVLADGPAAYYHLDEKPGATGREVAFEVTDGNLTVADVPTGFGPPATGTAFGYSWQPGLGNRSQALDGRLISVPVPPLVLPAGYTMGTKTLDIGPADQWSDIVVWWNSNIQDARGPIDPFVYPPGAHLVYVPPVSVA